jgi:hypothetical protein
VLQDTETCYFQKLSDDLPEHSTRHINDKLFKSNIETELSLIPTASSVGVAPFLPAFFSIAYLKQQPPHNNMFINIP